MLCNIRLSMVQKSETVVDLFLKVHNQGVVDRICSVILRPVI